MKITRLAIDLAKTSFYVAGKSDDNKIVLQKKATSMQLKKVLLDLEPCKVFMEACGSSNYWGRFAESQGHEVFLISPQHVKPYVTSAQKNDKNDTLAILEASSRPGQYFQKPKTEFCQEVQMILTTRTQLVSQRVALTNHIRGLLLENGIAVQKGNIHLEKTCNKVLQESENETSFTQLVKILMSQYKSLEVTIKELTDKIQSLSKVQKNIERLTELPGVGPISAAMFFAHFGDGKGYKNGRQAAACLGLVPRQHSTGGRNTLFGITKRGNSALRTALIHGGRSYVRALSEKGPTGKLSEWVYSLLEVKGVNKTAVALANKNARIMWSMLRNGTEFKMT